MKTNYAFRIILFGCDLDAYRNRICLYYFMREICDDLARRSPTYAARQDNIDFLEIHCFFEFCIVRDLQRKRLPFRKNTIFVDILEPNNLYNIIYSGVADKL